MKSYKVTTDMPIPRSRKGNTKYDFPDLEVGQSIAVTTRQESNAFRTLAKHRGLEITERTLTEKGKKIIRIWRTK